jgi:hypothetical protein
MPFMESILNNKLHPTCGGFRHDVGQSIHE